jgi:Zn finger protein HypA/HybF involved in hydrogenase expression
MIGGVKVTCKNCGKQADSSAFVLDPVLKKVVCPECVRKRKVDAIAAKNGGSVSSTMSSSNSPSSSPSVLRVSSSSTSKPTSSNSQSGLPPKPLDWDEEDDRLEKLAKKKQTMTQSTSVTYIDDDKAKVMCTKCKYKYTLNVFTGVPKFCPYCGTASPQVKPKY